jgi:hypothetical protein
MLKELAEWLRIQAHELVRVARAVPNNPEEAGRLEAMAIEMLQRALDIEKAERW